MIRIAVYEDSNLCYINQTIIILLYHIYLMFLPITLDANSPGLSPLSMLRRPVSPVCLPPPLISRRPGVSWTLARG